MDSIGPASVMSTKAMEKNVGALKAAMEVQQQMAGQLLQGITPPAANSAGSDSAQLSSEGKAMVTKELGG